MHFSWQSLFFAFVLIFFIYNAYADPIQTDHTNKVEIINLHVQPPIIKVGDTFTINATLVNNSPNPIYVIGSCEEGFFHTIFDNHVTVIHKSGYACTANLIERLVNSGEKITATSPSFYFLTYRATVAGTANANVAFSYFVVQNQSDPNHYRIWNSTSKSFLFTIYDNNTGIKTMNETVPEFSSLSGMIIAISIIGVVIISMKFRFHLIK